MDTELILNYLEEHDCIYVTFPSRRGNFCVLSEEQLHLILENMESHQVGNAMTELRTLRYYGGEVH